MRIIPTRKFSGATHSRGPGRGQSGQGLLEYMLILLMVVSIFVVFARPFMNQFSQKFQSITKKGFFTDDPTGANFYYYPLPRG
jgi:hypothetical protein